MEILKVSSKSNPSKVAGAIANIYREKGSVEIQTIGAGSLNQAIKAIAICRGFVAPTGDNLVVIPAFNDTIINGEQKTDGDYGINSGVIITSNYSIDSTSLIALFALLGIGAISAYYFIEKKKLSLLFAITV